ESRRQVLAQHCEIDFSPFQALELRGELRGARQQLERCHTVLSRQLLDGGQPPLDVVLALRVDVQALTIALELPSGLANLHRGIFREGDYGRELRVDRRHCPQRLKRAADTCVRIAIFGLVERLERRLRGFGEPPTVHEAGPLLRETGDLAFLEPQGLQLADLVFEQVELRLAVAGAAFQLECALEHLPPDPIGDPYLPDQRLESPIFIEQLLLRGGARQRLELVLTVDIDEDASHLAQEQHRNGLAVEVRARAPVRRQNPPDHELVTAGDRL